MSRDHDPAGPPIRTRIDAGAHPFLRDLDPRHVGRLASCATDRICAAGDFICREGLPADSFFLVREGRVALEVHVPARGGVRLGIVRSGEVLGWSWAVRPYRWRLDARCLEPVRLIEVDARRLRRECLEDHELGYQILTRLLSVMGHRLHSARVQLQGRRARARARGGDASA